MEDSFCALPWKHLLITAYGGAQTCCLSRGMIRENNTDVSLYTKSIEQVFNAESQRRVRQQMLAGEKPYECQLCYDNEKDGLKSERHTQNDYWKDLDGFDVEEAKKVTLEDGSTTIERPAYYQMLVSNVCNLACRMCNGEASSKIENDPVHSAWAPGYNNFDYAVREGSVVEVGPAPKLGITNIGFRKKRIEDKNYYYMTVGKKATLNVPLISKNYNYQAVHIKLLNILYDDLVFTVSINGENHKALIKKGDCECKVFFNFISTDCKDIMINLCFEGQENEVNVEVINLLTKEVGKKKKENAVSRFADKQKSLFDQDSFLFHDLLGKPDSLRRIYVTGGEPFYAKPLLRMIDYLEDTNNSNNIHAIFTTNATILSDKLLQQLQGFKKINIGLSLDGVGKIQEYIRHPSNWGEIEANIKRFMNIDGVAVHAIPALQVQNILYLSDLLRFCDSLNLHYGVNLVYYPNYLNVLTLPMNARKVAAQRLQHYVDHNCPSEVKKQVVTPIIHHLLHGEDQFSHEILREFMLFTNDLDKSRGQSFRDTFPELIDLYKEVGFSWTDETKFLHKIKCS